ncbi:MAG: hypothetical protein ABF916_06140 [Acetobacter fabarum]|uniref:hypothetical protein n=1 Tax=Acetobacter fabarum TaxID=483199 RepID=UPI0039EC7F40
MSRYLLPGSYQHASSCSAHIAGGVVGLHPLLRHLLRVAPNRAEVLALFSEPPQLAEEAALQQAGGQMLGMFMPEQLLPYRARALQLETLFRGMLEHALSLAIKARCAPEQEGEEKTENPAVHAMLMAYIAAQHVVGARHMAMELYNRR